MQEKVERQQKSFDAGVLEKSCRKKEEYDMMTMKGFVKCGMNDRGDGCEWKIPGGLSGRF